MSKDKLLKLKGKLQKLQKALEYAKKDNDEIKIIYLKDCIKDVKGRINDEEIMLDKKGR